jgi:hypothetical protein
LALRLSLRPVGKAAFILRKIDINKWEKITDEEGLKGYQKCFDDRDQAAAEKSGAAHAG